MSASFRKHKARWQIGGAVLLLLVIFTIVTTEDNPEADEVNGIGEGVSMPFAGETFDTTATPAASSRPMPTPSLSVQAERLWDDYASNQVAAERKYEGNVIAVKGPVVRVMGSGAGATVALTGRDALVGGGIIGCEFPESEQGAVSGLSNGDIIEVVGECAGLEYFGLVEGVRMVDCRVASGAKAAASSEAIPELMGAEQIVAEFRSNEVAARQRFIGKTVTLSAQVNSVERGLWGSIHAVLGAGDELADIYCFFDDSEADKVAALSPPQGVTIRGVCESYDTAFMGVGQLKLGDCTIVRYRANAFLTSPSPSTEGWSDADDAFSSSQDTSSDAWADTNDAEELLRAGIQHLNDGNLLFALNTLKSAAEHMPDSAEVHRFLGRAYYNLEDWVQACSEYLQAVSLKPEYAEAYFWLAGALVKLGSEAQALDAYRTARLLDSGYVTEHLRLIPELMVLVDPEDLPGLGGPSVVSDDSTGTPIPSQDDGEQLILALTGRGVKFITATDSDPSADLPRKTAVFDIVKHIRSMHDPDVSGLDDDGSAYPMAFLKGSFSTPKSKECLVTVPWYYETFRPDESDMGLLFAKVDGHEWRYTNWYDYGEFKKAVDLDKDGVLEPVREYMAVGQGGLSENSAVVSLKGLVEKVVFPDEKVLASEQPTAGYPCQMPKDVQRWLKENAPQIRPLTDAHYQGRRPGAEPDDAFHTAKGDFDGDGKDDTAFLAVNGAHVLQDRGIHIYVFLSGSGLQIVDTLMNDDSLLAIDIRPKGRLWLLSKDTQGNHVDLRDDAPILCLGEAFSELYLFYGYVQGQFRSIEPKEDEF